MRDDRDEAILYIQIPEVVLKDSNLTAIDLLVFGRIYGFPCYHEASDSTCTFLGGRMQAETVRKSRAKLEKLGWIVMIENTGRGKVYRANREKVDIESAKLNQERAASSRQPDRHARAGQTGMHVPTEYKKDNKVKNIVSKETILVRSVEPDTTNEQEKQYGNPNVNEALRAWQDATGYDYTSNKYERNAIANLLKRKDVNALGGFIALVTIVKLARRADSRFAPQIAKPSQLGGKYSKLEALLDWHSKQGAENSNAQQHAQTYAPQQRWQPDTAIIGTYYKPHPEVTYEEPEQLTPEEEAKLLQAKKEDSARCRAILEEGLKRAQERKQQNGKR